MTYIVFTELERMTIWDKQELRYIKGKVSLTPWYWWFFFVWSILQIEASDDHFESKGGAGMGSWVSFGCHELLHGFLTL